MATIFFCLLGALFRIAQYASNQSFWEDESALLLNVLHFPTRVLAFHRLDAVPMTQATPPVWLWWFKAMTVMFGKSELALRLLPAVMAVVALPVFAVVCQRALSNASMTAWAVGLFAVADNLIFQSASMKQYSGDVLAAIVLWGSVFAWRTDDPPLARLARASLLTAGLVWCSYTSVFVLAAIALSLLPDLAAHRKTMPRAVLALAPAGVSVALLDWFTLRVQRDAYLAAYWHERFVDVHHPLAIGPWLAGRTFEMFRFADPPAGGVLVIFAIAGALALRRTLARPVWLSIVLPFPILLLASALRLYPYGGTRVTLFLVPFQLMLVSAGIVQGVTLLPLAYQRPWMKAGISATGAVLVAIPLTLAVYHLAVPRTHGDARQAIAFLRQHRHDDSPVYAVEDSTSYDLMVYWPEHDTQVKLFADHREQFTDAQFWILLSFYQEKNARDYRTVLAQQYATAQKSPQYHSRGADVVYYTQNASK